MLSMERSLRPDTYIRKENLTFSGIPEDKTESNQTTIKKIRNIFKEKLGIEDAENKQFQRCHRLGTKKPRDIIVRFVLFPDRGEVWSQRQKLKDSGITMNEDFPLEIEKRRSKLYPVFKLAKEKKHKL